MFFKEILIKTTKFTLGWMLTRSCTNTSRSQARELLVWANKTHLPLVFNSQLPNNSLNNKTRANKKSKTPNILIEYQKITLSLINRLLKLNIL